MRDCGLADCLVILALEPLDACLVRGADGLRVGPSTQGTSLVEGEGMPLFGRVVGGHNRGRDRGGHFGDGQRRRRRRETERLRFLFAYSGLFSYGGDGAVIQFRG